MKDRTKLFIGIFILLGTISLGVWQWNIMQAHQFEIDHLSTEGGNLTVIKEELISEYQEVKVNVTAARETATQELSLVFPTDEDITNLTRLLDDFSLKNNFDSNPFFINSINYQSEMKSEDENYRYIPVSLGVDTSSKNLLKFLEFVENSGSLEGEVRLMGIDDMNVSYPAEYGGTFDVNFVINAYFTREI